MSTVSRILWFLAVGLLLAAGYVVWRQQSLDALLNEAELADQVWVVDDCDRDCGTLVVGEHVIEVEVHNRSNQSRRIIGLSQGCTETCCFSSYQSGPVTVPPGGSFTYSCELTVNVPGPFRVGMALFLEEHGIREVIVAVRGAGVEAGR